RHLRRDLRRDRPGGRLEGNGPRVPRGRQRRPGEPQSLRVEGADRAHPPGRWTVRRPQGARGVRPFLAAPRPRAGPVPPHAPPTVMFFLLSQAGEMLESRADEDLARRVKDLLATLD